MGDYSPKILTDPNVDRTRSDPHAMELYCVKVKIKPRQITSLIFNQRNRRLPKRLGNFACATRTRRNSLLGYDHMELDKAGNSIRELDIPRP